MERVKDIEKLKVNTGYVLLRVYMKDSLILTPGQSELGGPQIDYAEVVSFGPTVTDINVGDIVIDFKAAEGFKWGVHQYVFVARMNIKFLVEKDNFTFSNDGEGKIRRLKN